MKKGEKTAIIIAVVLIFAGIAISSFAFRNLTFSDKSGKEFVESFSTAEYVTNTHVVDEKFTDISINTSVADVTFELANDGKCKVVCREEKGVEHTVSVKGGKLIIEKTDEREWYEHISIGVNFEPETVTVYLPQKDYNRLYISDNTGKVEISEIFSFRSAQVETDTGYIDFYAKVKESMAAGSDTGHVTISCGNPQSLNIQTSTGYIFVDSMKVHGDIYAGASTGHVELENVRCENLEVRTSTGAINLEHVIASGKADISASTGNVELRGFDAAEIYISTSTGQVSGTILSDKVFLTESSTGSIDVPKSVTGGICEISTSTGDIEIEIA